MSLKWIASGGRVDALVLVGRAAPVGQRSRQRSRHRCPMARSSSRRSATSSARAAELRERFPKARIAEVRGVDHFFVGKRDEMARLVTDELARTLG